MKGEYIVPYVRVCLTLFVNMISNVINSIHSRLVAKVCFLYFNWKQILPYWPVIIEKTKSSNKFCFKIKSLNNIQNTKYNVDEAYL